MHQKAGALFSFTMPVPTAFPWRLASRDFLPYAFSFALTRPEPNNRVTFSRLAHLGSNIVGLGTQSCSRSGVFSAQENSPSLRRLILSRNSRGILCLTAACTLLLLWTLNLNAQVLGRSPYSSGVEIGRAIQAGRLQV